MKQVLALSLFLLLSVLSYANLLNGKLYVSDVRNQAQVLTDQKVLPAQIRQTHTVQNLGLRTEKESNISVVLSNGVALSLDESSYLATRSLLQEPFVASAQTQTEIEPSVSKFIGSLYTGGVSICTPQFVSSSSFRVSTRLCQVRISQGQYYVRVNEDGSEDVFVLSGKAKLYSGDAFLGELQPNEAGRLTRNPQSNTPTALKIEPIKSGENQHLAQLLTLACAQRKTVLFELQENVSNEIAGAEGDQEFVARPLVPQNPPTHIVVSPDRLY